MVIAINIILHYYIVIFNPKYSSVSIEDKVSSDSWEALIGAIYYDKGHEASEKFILNMWKKFINSSELLIVDPKTKLQEFSLKKFKSLPIYKLVSSSGRICLNMKCSSGITLLKSISSLFI